MKEVVDLADRCHLNWSHRRSNRSCHCLELGRGKEREGKASKSMVVKERDRKRERRFGKRFLGRKGKSGKKYGKDRRRE